MQDVPKAVWSIPYVSAAFFFSSLKQNFIAYRSSKVFSRPDCIFGVYSNCCCSCSLKPAIIKIGQSSHKMCSNNSEFSGVYDSFKCLYEKCQVTYWMLHVYIYIYMFNNKLVRCISKGVRMSKINLLWKWNTNSIFLVFLNKNTYFVRQVYSVLNTRVLTTHSLDIHSSYLLYIYNRKDLHTHTHTQTHTHKH